MRVYGYRFFPQNVGGEKMNIIQGIISLLGLMGLFYGAAGSRRSFRKFFFSYVIPNSRGNGG
ncbi:hypothetical protein YH66_09985 [[Brevibacterium] flavum]|uniref:Uncharacterized protein n=2 Tax=Corynebacterium TaxID=1716 RepID=A0A0F6WR32_9CORY|nr:hypothetical protein C624_09990 [Corynebacterium glutamicum SCgG1]AGN22596.1 hypothetical protein C629_10000 [Corynebacterium glutamicum SCgG2]AKF27855.1 hypothetical protein YH66_09985 [[Brevibacterium] flavum]ANE08690.1 hypothetical protein A3654_10050 [Corynebacterium glutamicum]AST21101.1 hypothetical protein CEY17_10120 [Corynebacterium glutamicum ATCC 14067]EGV40412.1 hypothetical protein CgS9114_07511 [Corynebacterium glutamicum S9114]EOA65824.1 hypothetical protein J433_02220 [Cory